MNRRDFLGSVAAVAAGASVPKMVNTGVPAGPSIHGEGLFCVVPTKDGGLGMMVVALPDVARYGWEILDMAVLVPEGQPTPQDVWNEKERGTKRQAFA